MMKKNTLILLFFLICLTIISCNKQSLSNKSQNDRSQSGEYIVLEEMGRKQGYDRKKVIAFLKNDVGITGNNIGEVEIGEDHSAVQLDKDSQTKLVDYMGPEKKDKISYVSKNDFQFFMMSSVAEGHTPVDNDSQTNDHDGGGANENDHYGNDGPHGTGIGHSDRPDKDPCTDHVDHSVDNPNDHGGKD